METKNIPSGNLNAAVHDFCAMKTNAEKAGDKFYAAPELYNHHYSFGNLWSDFVFQSWPEIQAVPSLRGISQITIQLLQNSMQKYPRSLKEGDANFDNLSDPKSNAGFRQSTPMEDYICCCEEWREWHRQWLMNHPKDIDWTDDANLLFPNPATVLGILRAELQKEGVMAGGDKEVATLFHERVMKHKGTELKAYATEIGDKICTAGYYQYEHQLSVDESLQCGSPRRIYSIENKNNKMQYISIDFAHGMFELLDEHGSHLGEYRFDGSFNATAEVSHSLRTLSKR